ncbi:MAG: phage minor tail protein L [Afipia sp.]|nr:phage minor tail protein L [Afipia sp.]OJW65477.1 MAG: phage minor tail protein L [Afipia sp. 64-13]
MTLATDVQRPNAGDTVELYDVDCTAIFGEVLRFSPVPLIPDASSPAPAPITWRGQIYAPRACKSEGWLWDGQGPLPQPKLTVGNTDLAISALCIAYSDLQGAIVTRHRVPFKHLDGMPDADPDIEHDPDIFVIDQKTTQNKLVVEFMLGTAIDIEGRMIPGRQVVQGYCPWRYRRWNGSEWVYPTGTTACPYTGEAMFDERGNPTDDPAKDRCAKRLGIGCKRRYPTGDLPFGGFPGAAKYRG